MPDSDEAYFSSIPWCQTLLSDSNYTIVPTRFRFVKPDGEDVFFGRTINTASTISAALTQRRNPSSEGSEINELRTFVSLRPSLDGYPGICHGGIQVAILDEVMGLLLNEIKDQRYARAKTAGEKAERWDSVTAELNMKYLKAVATPGTYCVTVRLTEHRGRKHRVDGTIADRKGTVLAKASALFINIPNQKI